MPIIGRKPSLPPAGATVTDAAAVGPTPARNQAADAKADGATGGFAAEGTSTAADVTTLKGKTGGLGGACRPDLRAGVLGLRWVARVVEEGGERVLEELGGKRRAPAPAGAEVGSVVQARGVDTPALSKVLAAPGSARAAMYGIAEAHGLAPSFSPEVMAEVAAFQANTGIDDPTLVDMTDKPFITIDNDDSRDLDQAMHIERRPGGGWDVYYALSDASYYCPPGSALFNEALKRGNSFYLPGLMVPMLPEELSTDLVSLNEGVDRRSLVFKISLDADGEVLPDGVHVDRARVHSRKKLAYNGVQRYHDALASGEARSDAKHHGHDFTNTLLLLKEVGEVRRARADANGVVRHQRKAVNVKCGKQDTTSFVLLSDERNDVEKWNEQISLLCNIEGAKLLNKLEQQQHVAHGVYRVHPRPERGRLIKLAEYIDGIASAQVLDDKWLWDPDQETLAAYLTRIPIEGPHGRVGRAIHRQALLVNGAASYEGKPGAHYGVGTDEGYARFSAPMRELVGIHTHKELLELLGHADHTHDDDALQQQVLAKATEAAKLQRKLTKEANRFAIDAVFESELRTDEPNRAVRRGTILGMKGDRLYVELDDPAIEIKVYLDKLKDQGRAPGAMSQDGMTMVRPSGRRYVVGDAIDLRLVESVDDRYLFAPVD